MERSGFSSQSLLEVPHLYGSVILNELQMNENWVYADTECLNNALILMWLLETTYSHCGVTYMCASTGALS